MSSLALSRFVTGFLWGVAACDPATFAITATILVGVAAAASVVPARAATSQNPRQMLQEV